MHRLYLKYKKFFISFVIIGYTLFFALFLQIPDGKFHIYFLDIGQGDAILIKTPENHIILIDGGPKNTVMEELSEVLPFFNKKIDLLVNTHPHADHIEGLVAVLNRFDVQNVLLTGIDFDNSSYDEFLKIINEKQIPFFIADEKTDFIFGNVIFDLIFPLNSFLGEKIENVNNSSIAINVNYKGHSILLTGDLEKEAEQELIIANANLKADILKAGHHGSRTASTKEFLQKVVPQTVVIQVGKGNTFNHPHLESIQRFYRANVRKILRNDLDGRIEFEF